MYRPARSDADKRMREVVMIILLFFVFAGTILLDTTDAHLTAGNLEHTQASQRIGLYMDAASAHTASISYYGTMCRSPHGYMHLASG